MSAFKSKQLVSSAYHPQTDGQTERAHRTIQQMLRCMVEHESEWDDALPVAEMFYNNATSSSSLKSPYEVVYGRPMRLHFDNLCVDSGTPAAE